MAEKQIPTLIQVLKSEYDKLIARRPDLQKEELNRGKLPVFLEFAEHWLSNNRPVEQWYPGDGPGFRLPDGRLYTLSECNVDQDGDRVNAEGSVGITAGDGYGKLPEQRSL